MAYSTLGWQNGQEPAINAENLNHMDQGIADADAAATAAATIAGQASAALEGKLSKQTGNSRVYTNNPSGVPDSLEYAAAATPLTIPYRTAAGNIYTAAPTADGHATTKKYVDDNFAPSTENGYVEKQTTTSAAGKVYVCTNTGDSSLAIIPGNTGTVAPTGTGVVVTTSGRIRTDTPTGPYHAANKKYVDDNFFQKAVVTPSLSTYQDINGYTWQDLYTAMQNAGDSPIYLNNADRWLHFGTNRVDTICNQFITFIFDEILENKFFFVLKYVKEQSGTQTIQEIQCSITSAGVISATQS